MSAMNATDLAAIEGNLRPAAPDGGVTVKIDGLGRLLSRLEYTQIEARNLIAEVRRLTEWKASMLTVHGAADHRLRPLLAGIKGSLGRNIYEVAAEEIEGLRALVAQLDPRDGCVCHTPEGLVYCAACMGAVDYSALMPHDHHWNGGSCSICGTPTSLRKPADGGTP